jgi:hypothetical protein
MLLPLICLLVSIAGVYALVRPLDGEARRRSPALVFLAAAPIVLFSALTIQDAVPDGRLRLTLEALRFGPDLETFSVGGNLAQDELFIPPTRREGDRAVESRLLQFERRGPAVELVADSETSAAATPAVVSVDGVIAGSSPIGPDTVICIGACDSTNALRLVFDTSVNALVSTEEPRRQGAPLPRRTPLFGIVPLPERTAFEQIYPLRHFAPEAPGRAALNSFLYFDDAGAARIADLDRSVHVGGLVSVAPADGSVSSGLCFEGSCATASRISISIVEFGAPPAESGAMARKSRLSERRSFRASLSDDGDVVLTLDTADYRELTADEIVTEEARQQALGIQGEPWVRLGARGLESTGVSQVSFRYLGGAFRESLDHRLFLRRAQPTVAHGAEIASIENGEAIRLGEPASALVRVLQFDSTWPAHRLAFIILIVGGVVGVVATWGARSASGTALMIFAALDILVTLRVLIALQAAYVDPASTEAQQAPVHALAAYLLAPLILSLFCRETYLTPLRLVAHAVFVVFAGFYVERMAGPLGETWRAIGTGVVGLSFVLAAIAGAASRTPREWLERIDLSALRAMGAEWAKLSPAFWTLAALAIAVRLVPLLLFGAQEAIPGAGARLSVLYVPLAILAFAALFTALESASNRLPLYFAAGVLVVLIYLVPILLTGDFGSLIYALPIAFVGFAFAVRSSDDKRTRMIALSFLGALLAAGSTIVFLSDPVAGVTTFALAAITLLGGLLMLYAIVKRGVTALAAPALLAAAAILVVNVLPSLPSASSSRIETVTQTETTEDDLDLLADSQRFNNGWVRVLSVTDQRRLDEFGTIQAENQREALAHMADHSRRWAGEGLLTVESPTSLRRYHMDDNVPSVHLMGAFGRLGAGTLVLALFVVLAVSSQRRADEAPEDDMGYYLTFISIATLAVVSAYMVLGNLEAAPFTGRNMYMLAVRSTSDYVEAITLLCLALTGLWWRRRA